MIVITPKGTKKSKLHSDLGLYLIDTRSNMEFSEVICKNEAIKYFREVEDERLD